MSNPSQRKGTHAETAWVRYLQQHGWPHAERRAPHGAHDRGDIAGCPGLVFEVKNTQRVDLAGWVAELKAEVLNAGADAGAVVAKRRGSSDPGDWYAVLPAAELVRLLHLAGWGDDAVLD